MSTAYHTQKNGQKEVVNMCLQQYLRALTSNYPSRLSKFLHGLNGIITPQPVVRQDFHHFRLFMRKPTYLITILKGDITFRGYRFNVHKQERNFSKTEKFTKINHGWKNTPMLIKKIHFNEGDWVYVKLQPYRQQSAATRQWQKLSKRFFGLFQMIQKIGSVAYKLQLPKASKIHNVFHVSFLKKNLVTLLIN